MKKTIIETASGKIACQESSGSGRAAVLIHGNSSSSRAYTRQMQSALGNKHRLIAIDLPGHGESANATDPAQYTLPGYARVLTDVTRYFGVQEAVFVGWSLGGHIVLEAAPDLPQAAGFVIFGTPPLAFPPAMEHAFLPNAAMGVGFSGDITQEQARAYVTAFFKPGVTDLPAVFIEDAMRTDGQARTQLAASIAPNGYRDEVDVVAKLGQPLAVLHGAEEQLVNGGYFDTLKMPTLWRGAVQSIADAGHAPQWEQPSHFDALIEAFMTDVR
jgi:pimeloyl-ACP methyl ester carboxylesterase